MRRVLSLIGSMVLATCACGAGAQTVRVQGLEGALLDNVQKHLVTLQKDQLDDTPLELDQVNSTVRTALRALGYYHPESRIEQTDKGDLVVHVTAGEPVRLLAPRIEIVGEAKEDADFQALVARQPQAGAVLHHGAYEAFKSALQTLAGQKGYFDQRFVEQALVIAADKNEAYWRIVFDSGMRYRFGETTVQDSQIRADITEALIPYAPDDPYDVKDVNELVRRLNNSQWFDYVVIEPRFDAARDHTLPMDVRVKPRARNAIEVGLGFSTDVGPRASLAWDKPWVNEAGHAFGVTTNVAGDEQELDATYRIPIASDPLREYYEFNTGLKNSTLNDTDSTALVVSGARHWELDNGWRRSVNLKWFYDSFTQGGVANDTMVISPGLSFYRVRSRGGMEPTWADSQRYSIDVASDWWGSQVSFVIVQTQQTWLRSIGANHRVIGRLHAGWMSCDDFDKVPPDLRFFAGGDQSVRGYDYKSISPTNAHGELTGGSRLITVSAEYNYRVKGPWWLAAFVDAGDAFRRTDEFDPKVGAGLGLRWSSPIGLVRFDVARGIGSEHDDGVKFYIGLGAQL